MKYKEIIDMYIDMYGFEWVGSTQRMVFKALKRESGEKLSVVKTLRECGYDYIYDNYRDEQSWRPIYILTEEQLEEEPIDIGDYINISSMDDSVKLQTLEIKKIEVKYIRGGKIKYTNRKYLYSNKEYSDLYFTNGLKLRTVGRFLLEGVDNIAVGKKIQVIYKLDPNSKIKGEVWGIYNTDIDLSFIFKKRVDK